MVNFLVIMKFYFNYAVLLSYFIKFYILRNFIHFKNKVLGGNHTWKMEYTIFVILVKSDTILRYFTINLLTLSLVFIKQYKFRGLYSL